MEVTLEAITISSEYGIGLGFNPYSNGSYFGSYLPSFTLVNVTVVSILILMEVTLEVEYMKHLNQCYLTVSILILMEVTLEVLDILLS